MTDREKTDAILDRIAEEVRKHKQQTASKIRRIHKALEEDMLESLQWENE